MPEFYEKLFAVLDNTTRLLRALGVSRRQHAGWAFTPDGRVFSLTPAWPEDDERR